jgi:MYXO-CTERM domain-containing protein
MRRALLLATVLAVPTLGSAQLTAGTMSFTNTDADPKASTINIAECRSTSARVEISWQTTGTVPAGSVTYTLYASNKDTANKTNFPNLPTDPNTQCPTIQDSSTPNNITVVQVGDPLTNATPANQPFSTAQIAAALKAGTVTDPCSTGGTVYLCIQGASGGTNFGTARATIAVTQTTPTAVPELLLPIAPGNAALTPRWADAATNTSWYQAQAISVADPAHLPSTGAFDPVSSYTGFDSRDTARHASGFVSGTQSRLAGLQNGVVYAVMITSYTADYNPGDPSNIGSGMPQLTTDFWQTYKSAGGQETGGCSSGLAGPVGLMVLAGALALIRRRK